MKNLVRLLCKTSFVAVLAVLPLSARADLTWGTGGTGGAGTWNDANTNWWNGASNVVWDSTGAYFAGTTGTVTVSGTQNATGVFLNTAFYTLQGGTINFTGGTPTLGGAANGQTISSVLQSANGLTFSGGGKTISGNNADLDGIINITSLVRVSNNNALGDSSAFADRIALQVGGILQLSTGVTLDKYITTVGGATTIESIGASTLTGNIVTAGSLFLQLDPGSTLTLSGNAGLGNSTSAVQTSSTGRLILDAAGGSQAFAMQIRGSTTVQANNVANVFGAVGSNIFMGEAAGDTTLALNGATIGNNLFLYGAAGSTRKVENMAAGLSTYSGQLSHQANVATTLRSTTSGTLRVSGLIGDSTFTASIQIGSGTNTNSGVVELSRAAGNTYDGGTEVNSGTLLVSNSTGSATGTGVVTVNSGGSLIGGGKITGAVNVNGGGTISGGATIGVLSTGNLSLASGSFLAVQINSITTGTGYDQVSVTGSVTLGGNLAITLGFTPVEDSLFFVLLNDGADAVTGLLSGYAQDEIFSMAGNYWKISYVGDSATSSFTGGNDVVLQAVPEPGTVALLGLAAAAGLYGVRRKVRSPKA